MGRGGLVVRWAQARAHGIGQRTGEPDPTPLPGSDPRPASTTREVLRAGAAGARSRIVRTGTAVGSTEVAARALDLGRRVVPPAGERRDRAVRLMGLTVPVVLLGTLAASAPGEAPASLTATAAVLDGAGGPPPGSELVQGEGGAVLMPQRRLLQAVSGVPLPTTPTSSAAPYGVAGTGALTASGIPLRAYQAYTAAASSVAATDPSCHLSWTVLAGIGRVESNHGRYGGSSIRANGQVSPPIIGIPLDGRPGVAGISDSDGGRYDGDTRFDRAVGPMQFIPGTWAAYGADGNRDGRKDPQNVDDAALAAAHYLCAGNANMSTQSGRWAAVFRYNHANSYVSLVLGLADAYAAGRGTGFPSPPSTVAAIGGVSASESPATVGTPPAVPVRSTPTPVTPPTSPTTSPTTRPTTSPTTSPTTQTTTSTTTSTTTTTTTTTSTTTSPTATPTDTATATATTTPADTCPATPAPTPTATPDPCATPPVTAPLDATSAGTPM